MPELSIIIPAWNEADYLPDTLSALHQSLSVSRVDAEVIVVDNESSDPTATLAADAGAKVVTETEHRIARVRNTGAAAAHSDWLLFVDADTRIRPAHLAAVMAAINAGCAGGGAPIGFDRPGSRAQRLGLAAWNTLSRRCRLAAGCFVFAPREWHTRIGGFSEQLYAGDEIGYSRRLDRIGRPRGRRFVILGTAPVISSARKMDWFRPWQHALVLATFVLFPWAGRFKRLSWFWYRRP